MAYFPHFVTEHLRLITILSFVTVWIIFLGITLISASRGGQPRDDMARPRNLQLYATLADQYLGETTREQRGRRRQRERRRMSRRLRTLRAARESRDLMRQLEGGGTRVTMDEDEKQPLLMDEEGRNRYDGSA